MTNEPEWMETFRRKWEGANTGGHNAISTPVMDEILSDIQDTIKEEKEKSYREGVASTEELTRTAYRRGQKDAFGVDREAVKKEGQAELLSKIEEEVKGLADETGPASVRMSAYKDVLNILSKYKAL